jgi:UDP-N-acetylglucosamine--N-acetylmuramyl-(pentapeptide) pyrophosphoryl-undecaprenol N-acetylglucosamine transferase
MNQIKKEKLRIVLAGGGTAGPVAPLLAVAEEVLLEHPQAEFLLIGTRQGPEATMAATAHIPFKTIYAGKLRRYLSLRTLLSPILVVVGFFQSILLLWRFRPNLAFGAGGYVQVPVLWAAWLLQIPVVIHQQDVQPSLANTLCAPIARFITITFEESRQYFKQGWGFSTTSFKNKVILTGNPIRQQFLAASRDQAQKFFNLEPSVPTLLVVGGGTGAQALNQLVEEALPELVNFAQVIHSTGRGKHTRFMHPRYHAFEFISSMGLAYAASDLVLARAGLATITELSQTGKASIIVPLPGTHQEANAALLERHHAALVYPQSQLTAAELINIVRQLLHSPTEQTQLGSAIRQIMNQDAAARITKTMLETGLIAHHGLRN